MEIDYLKLRVKNLRNSVDYYTNVLGFKIACENQNNCELHLAPFQSNLILEQANKIIKLYHASAQDVYWKMGLVVDDLGLATQWLRSRGHTVGKGKQFFDVGYLTHIQDPDGYVIELLQNTFRSSKRKELEQFSDVNSIGYNAQFSHISLRSRDIAKSIEFYSKLLGMKLMCQIDVPQSKFSLYFFSFHYEDIPSSLESIQSQREWLWQRPYTMMELLHRWGTEDDDEFTYQITRENELGFIAVGLKHSKMNPQNSLRGPDGELFHFP